MLVIFRVALWHLFHCYDCYDSCFSFFIIYEKLSAQTYCNFDFHVIFEIREFYVAIGSDQSFAHNRVNMLNEKILENDSFVCQNVYNGFFSFVLFTFVYLNSLIEISVMLLVSECR